MAADKEFEEEFPSEFTIEEVTESTPSPPKPKFGRGLSRHYSLYPSRPSLNSLLGALTATIDVVKFLYTNEFTSAHFEAHFVLMCLQRGVAVLPVGVVRSVGRDILFFGGSIVIIRMVVSALKEETIKS